MTDPNIEVLGVYALPITKDLLRQQVDILYGEDLTGSERNDVEKQCREQLANIVLVEALVRNRDKRFDVGDFVQPQEGIPRENWQAAWAEAYLTIDGKKLLVERWTNTPKDKYFRVAFFIHQWSSDKPLLTSYGEVVCPHVEKMPERLIKLVPYEPVD